MKERRSLFNQAIFLFLSSAVALMAAGWIKSNPLRLGILAPAAALMVAALVWIFRNLDFASPRLVNATTRQLAWIRIVVCMTALIYTVIEDLPALASLPLEMRNNYKFFYLVNHLPGSATLLSSPYLLSALQWTTAAMLLLGLIGFQTRGTLFLGGLGFFLIQGLLRDYTYLYHSGVVPVYLILIIPWMPCAAAWSVDRFLDRSKPQPSAQSVGIGIFAIYAVMALVYFASGLSKLRDSGLDWFRGDNIEQKLVKDALEPIFLNYKWKATLSLVQHHAPDFIFTIIGAAGLVAELGYVSVLFSRKAQIILPVMAFAVHLGILVFQHILFLDLLLLQLIFLDVDRLAYFWRRRFRSNVQSRSAPNGNDKSWRPASFVSASVLALIIAVLLLGWACRTEYYPVTSWRMYANPERKGPVYYLKILATLEDGRSIEIPLSDCSPAVIPNIRYFLGRAFLRKGRNNLMDKFLGVYVQRRNRDLAFGSPITNLEIQRWRWNYVAEPNDPRFGWITNVYPYDATSKPSSQP